VYVLHIFSVLPLYSEKTDRIRLKYLDNPIKTISKFGVRRSFYSLMVLLNTTIIDIHVVAAPADRDQRRSQSLGSHPTRRRRRGGSVSRRSTAKDRFNTASTFFFDHIDGSYLQTCRSRRCPEHRWDRRGIGDAPRRRIDFDRAKRDESDFLPAGADGRTGEPAELAEGRRRGGRGGARTRRRDVHTDAATPR